MDGRARWAAAVGVVVALLLIATAVATLTRSVLAFDDWSTQPPPPPVVQTLPRVQGAGTCRPSDCARPTLRTRSRWRAWSQTRTYIVRPSAPPMTPITESMRS